MPANSERDTQKQNAAARGLIGRLNCGWFIWVNCSKDSFCIDWNRRTTSVWFTDNFVRVNGFVLD